MTTTHRIVSNEGLFDSDNLRPCQTYSYVFKKSRVYYYHDVMNKSMNGTVRVILYPPIT